MSAGALAGIKVIDFGQMVSAPFCARLFADYGADVVKVELPGGDTARAAGPFPGDVSDPEKSGLYFINNTNKRGITCDVATEAGRALFLRLLAWADLLIENHSPAQMRAWGLDYATLAATNPDLVVVSITPFGQTGPYSEWNGYDLNAYHLTGASHRYCGRCTGGLRAGAQQRGAAADSGYARIAACGYPVATPNSASKCSAAARPRKLSATVIFLPFFISTWMR